MDPQLVKKSVISDDHNWYYRMPKHFRKTTASSASVMTGKSHKKHQMPHIANCIKCMNVDSEREDAKEMSKGKDL